MTMPGTIKKSNSQTESEFCEIASGISVFLETCVHDFDMYLRLRIICEIFIVDNATGIIFQGKGET